MRDPPAQEHKTLPFFGSFVTLFGVMVRKRVLWAGSLLSILLSWWSYAQEPTPPAPPASASPAPSAAPGPTATASATPSATASPPAEESRTPPPRPENAPPDLLPETGALPTPAAAPTPAVRDLSSMAPQALAAPGPASAAQRLKDTLRFREIRTVTEREPYAIFLWRSAGEAHTIEDRREYLRAYYHYLAARMHKLEPRLDTTIKSYEFGQLALVTQLNIIPTVPQRELETAAPAPRKSRVQSSAVPSPAGQAQSLNAR